MKKAALLLLIPFLLLSACSEKTATMTALPDPSTPATTTGVDWWHPTVGMTWQWQLSDAPVDTSYKVEVYDIDLYDTDVEVIKQLHDQGKKVICYISVGSQEDWRPDKDQFPTEVLGKDYDGWPGEKWLDVRRIDLLAPIIRARLDLCKEKGFDGVEPNNIEVYDNDTGFPLTYADQLEYFKWLVQEAHARGLAIGLKNASDMVVDALPYADFVITEDAFYYDEAQAYLPFIKAGKPIFAAEYTDMDVDFTAACQWGKENQVSFILKDRDLISYVEFCK
jgi:hypothetical protein